MSRLATDWALQQRDLKPAVKVLLWRLAEQCDPDTWKCDRTVESLAHDCMVCVATVRRHLRTLEAKGLVRCIQRYDGWGLQIASSYVLIADLYDDAHETEAIQK